MLLDIILIICIIYLCYWAFLSVNPIAVGDVRPTRDDIDKFYILSKIDDKYKPNTILICKDDIYNLKYPKYFKPNKCAGLGYMVKLVNNIDEANEYFENVVDAFIICQDVADGSHEARIMFQRDTDGSCRISSINEKHYIKSFNSFSFTDKNDIINKELNNTVTEIINSISEDINYCGLDVIYKSDEEFRNSEFNIVEINGNLSVDPMIHFNGNATLNFIFDIVLRNLYIGICNIKNGKGICNSRLLRSIPIRLYDYIFIRRDISILFADWD